MTPSSDSPDFDAQDLDAEALELWNELSGPDPPSTTTQIELFSFAQVCQLELGRIPVALDKALDPELGPMLQHYYQRLRAARDEEHKRDT